MIPGTFIPIITAQYLNSFFYKPEEYLGGKTICVMGTVQLYKGKPEIVVTKSEQIRVQ